jgi:hypothetical protein
VPLLDGCAVPCRCAIAPDDVYELFGRHSFLGAEHRFTRQLLQGPKPGTQPGDLRAEGQQGFSLVFAGVHQFLPLNDQARTPGRQPGQPVLIREACIHHGQQPAQPAQFGGHVNGGRARMRQLRIRPHRHVQVR